jgi:hypothetical protein
MTQPGTTRPINLLLLHTLRCGGHATLGRITAATGLDESDAESGLIDLGAAGLVVRSAGAFGGWGLTERGEVVDAERIAVELDAAGARPAVAEAFDRFLELNPELLELCTAWQLRTVDGAVTTNDHRDAAYDARVLDRFADLDRRLARVCADLCAVLPRFGRYRERLADALRRARSGESEYLADGTESYHAVWAQLHEDLLATLGIRRW